MVTKDVSIPIQLQNIIYSLAQSSHKTFSSTICYYSELGISYLASIKYEATKYKIQKPKNILQITKCPNQKNRKHIKINSYTYNRIVTFAESEKFTFSKTICYLSYLAISKDYDLDYVFVVDRKSNNQIFHMAKIPVNKNNISEIRIIR